VTASIETSSANEFAQRADRLTFGSLAASSRAFLALVGAHVLIWTLAPALMYQSVPKDTLEGIAWGNLWQFGYDKHPLLAPWLSAAFTDVFGSVGWPVFFASQLSVAICFWAIWKLARSMLPPWHAFTAVLLLEGIHYYNLSSFTFNPNIVMLPTWALLTLTFYRAMVSPSLGRWALAGACAGLAVLGKYESGVLFVVLGGLLVGTALGRRRLSTPGPYLAALAAIAVAAPNLIWLAQHDFISIKYALGYLSEGSTHGDQLSFVGTHLIGPLKFLGEQLVVSLPAILLWRLLAPGRLRFDRNNFDHLFVLALAVGPLLVTLSIGIATGVHLVPRWGFPFLNLSGVALLVLFPSELPVRRRKRLVGTVAGLTALMVVGLYWMIFVRPFTTGRPPYSIAFPTRPLAERVTQGWHQRYGSALPFVAGDRYLASGVIAYSPDRPVPFFDWDPTANPWTSESRMQRAGAVFVHRLQPGASGQAFDTRMTQRFPRLTGQTVLSLPQLSAAPLPPVRVWVAYLPPAPVATDALPPRTAATVM
jgi:hypothetical protein